jgi:hypothetical protein
VPRKREWFKLLRVWNDTNAQAITGVYIAPKHRLNHSMSAKSNKGTSYADNDRTERTLQTTDGHRSPFPHHELPFLCP